MSAGFAHVFRSGRLRFGGRWRLAGTACFDDLQGEVLQFAEQGAEFLRVVEQGLVFGELAGGEPSGNGFAADLAGPFGVGPVQAGRVCVAAAARLAAGVGADDEAAGQGEAGLSELGGDLVAGRALSWAGFHATHRLRSAGLASFHSSLLWKVPAWEASWSRQTPRWPRISRGGGRRRCRRRR